MIFLVTRLEFDKYTRTEALVPSNRHRALIRRRVKVCGRRLSDNKRTPRGQEQSVQIAKDSI